MKTETRESAHIVLKEAGPAAGVTSFEPSHRAGARPQLMHGVSCNIRSAGVAAGHAAAARRSASHQQLACVRETSAAMCAQATAVVRKMAGCSAPSRVGSAERRRGGEGPASGSGVSRVDYTSRMQSDMGLVRFTQGKGDTNLGSGSMTYA